MSNIRTTVQSNVLVLSRSNFSVPQRRILSAIIETFSPFLRNDLGSKRGMEISYEPAFDDLCRIVYKASDLSRPDDYSEIRTALEQLKSKNFFIETEDAHMGTSLILKWKFEKRAEYIDITVDKELLEMALDLSKGYTLYQTKVVLSLTSIYAMKLYEILCMWRNRPEFFIGIDELRRLTDTHGKYILTADFKKRVIDIAKEQLDSSDITDLRFTYSEKKKGKRIIGFTFYIHKTKNAHEIDDLIKKNPPSLKWDFSKDLIENFQKYNLLIKGKNLELVKEYKLQLGEQKLAEEIERIAAYAIEKPNPSGYIIKSLKKNLEDLKKETINMSVDERKKHALQIRNVEQKTEPTKASDIIKTLFSK
jgi:plasmid replication initiation protein